MHQTENREKRIKRCSSRKGLRRLISVFLLISFLLCGCKSILVNGDLSFKAYPPIEPYGASDGIKQATLTDVDFAKYDIEGDSAYWMLPCHINPIYLDFDMEEETTTALTGEFKAVAYNESTGRFIYAYLTPVFKDARYNMDINTGLTVPKTGVSSNYAVPVPDGKTEGKDGYALVLMSFEPETSKYNVLYSRYYTSEYYSENQPILIAGQADGAEAYFIYDKLDDSVNIFDKDGNEISCRCYYSEINSSIQDMLDVPFDEIWKLKNLNMTFRNIYAYWRYSVVDVQVDSELLVYFSLQVEASKKPFDDKSVSDMIDENDEDADSDEDEDDGKDYDEEDGVIYISAAVSTFSLNIGGPDAPIKFTSSIKDEAKQECENQAKKRPAFYIDLPYDIQLKAEKKLIKDNKELSSKEILQCATGLADYSSAIDSKLGSYTQNGNAGILNLYYSSISNTMKNGYTVFDTADMKKHGINIYYALAGITSMDDLYISYGGETIGVMDPRTDEYALKGMEDAIRNHGYNTYRVPDVYSRVAQYVAARVPTTEDYSFFIGNNNLLKQYSVAYLYAHYADFFPKDSLVYYFSKNGSDVMYPFVTPGLFLKSENDSSRPTLQRSSYSPYSAYDQSCGTDGFYKYNYKQYYLGLGNSLQSCLPVVMVYGAQNYNDGKSTKGYYAIDCDHFETMSKDGKYTYPLPKMVIDDTTTFTIQQPIYVKCGTESVYYKSITCEVTIPTKYRMEFPETTTMGARGNIWIGENVKALKGLGCVTYKDKSGNTRANGATGLPYDDLLGKSWQPSVDDKTYYSWIQEMHQGVNGRLFDEGVIGQAKDVGTYTTADGKSLVAMLTDESIRFYELGEDGRYKAYDQIMMDTIKRISGYGLNVEDASTEEEKKSSTEKISDKAMEDDPEYSLLAENLLPYNKSKLMICHEGDGVSLYDMGGDTMMKLLGGHYYNIYPMKNGKYMLLGYQTEEYDYTPADLSMAKYYIIDLAKLISDETNTNVSSYIDQLRDLYHSRTHTLRIIKKDENGDPVYEIVAPDPDTDTEFARAQRLFTGSESDTLKELEAICKEYDVTVTEELKKYAKEVAEKIQKQRKALNEYYKLIGIQMDGGRIPDSWQYLMNESRVFTATYEGMLEIMLVEMVLSDYYRDFNVTHKLSTKDYSSLLGVHPDNGALTDEYSEYRKAYKDWQEMRVQNETLVQVEKGDKGVDIQDMDEIQLSDTIVDLYTNRTNEDDAQNITQMEFYQAVLQDIVEKYELVNDPDGTKDIPDFESYMNTLFADISPDYGKDIFERMQDSGYEQFFVLSGLPRQNEENEGLLPWKETELLAELAKCRYEWQVEEIMVKYNLMTAKYHDSTNYQNSWTEYYQGEYDGDLEKQKKAFEKADCHAIITSLKKNAAGLGTGKSWDEAVADILRKAGNSPIIE